MTDLAISEVFGPTVQGEGPSLGRRCGFVRLGRCNLKCRWCDTPYTWDWDGANGTAYDPAVEVRRVPLPELVAHLCDMHVQLVVLTGGEPMLQQAALAELAAALVAAGMAVEVETNGTRMPGPDLAKHARFNVSPKLAASGAGTPQQRIVPAALAALAALPGTAFKFVVSDTAELAEVAALVGAVAIPPGQVWIMPEGTTPAQVLAGTAHLADAVVAAGWNLTTRLHVLAWGNERGR